MSLTSKPIGARSIIEQLIGGLKESRRIFSRFEKLIDSIVEEPFGRDSDDLDLDRYCQTIREGVEGSLGATSNAC